MAIDCVTEYFENYSNSEATEVVYLADVDLPGPEWDTIPIMQEDRKEKLI